MLLFRLGARPQSNCYGPNSLTLAASRACGPLNIEFEG